MRGSGNVWHEAISVAHYADEEFFRVYAQETPRGDWAVVSWRWEEVQFLPAVAFHDTYRLGGRVGVLRAQHLNAHLYRETRGHEDLYPEEE